jgi:cytohesin
MKSTKLQLLVTLAAILTAAALFATKGLSPQKDILDYALVGDREGLHKALIWGAEDNTKPRTPLHFTVEKNWKEETEVLIARGADVNATDMDGRTPLYMAAGTAFYYQADICKQSEVVELLIAHGANVNIKDKRGVTPLLCAALCNKSVTELLIAHGADVNARDEAGQTPLYMAARVATLTVFIESTELSKQKELMELLILHGAEVNVRCDQGRTPLHGAVYSSALTELLIAHGAEVNVRDNEGMTPLGLAIKEGHIEIAALLRQHGGKE